jgi:hypothetical protein
MSRFHVSKETTQSPKRVLNIGRIMGNVKKHNILIILPFEVTVFTEQYAIRWTTNVVTTA